MTFQWHSELLPSAVEVIGQTPMVELSRLVAHAGLSGRLLAKLECLDPNHPIQGGGYAIADLRFIRRECIDGYFQTSGRDST